MGLLDAQDATSTASSSIDSDGGDGRSTLQVFEQVGVGLRSRGQDMDMVRLSDLKTTEEGMRIFGEPQSSSTAITDDAAEEDSIHVPADESVIENQLWGEGDLGVGGQERLAGRLEGPLDEESLFYSYIKKVKQPDITMSSSFLSSFSDSVLSLSLFLF